jgi:hypothetical protein
MDILVALSQQNCSLDVVEHSQAAENGDASSPQPFDPRSSLRILSSLPAAPDLSSQLEILIHDCDLRPTFSGTRCCSQTRRSASNHEHVESMLPFSTHPFLYPCRTRTESGSSRNEVSR